MKLHPEEIEVVSFDTVPDVYYQSDVITIEPNHPTPATHCFVCD